MKVFILSLLAVSCVHAHVIRYPYHEQLLTYTPARGEFPVYNELAQGLIRYYDNNGAERLVRYNYPEPLYGVRRYSYSAYGSDGNQYLRTQGLPETGFTAASYYQIQDTEELAKAREENFRRWCEQRYQALKAEMEKLRAEGLKPSTDMMAQLQPLEKIITSSTYTITESPEIKQLRDEHLRIWNEARLKVLQQEADHLRFQHGNRMTSEYGNEVNVNLKSIIGETAEQKKAREEHLRIYNEQLAKVKQIEAEQKLQQGNLSLVQVKDTQIYNTQQQIPNFELKSSFQQGGQQQQITQVVDTPEVIKAREEHLRLVNEAKLRAQTEGIKQESYDDGSYKAVYNTESGYKAESGYKVETPSLKYIPAIQQPVQPIQNIAILQTSLPINQGIQQEQQSSILKSTSGEVQQQQPIVPIQDTPEVIKAREEHLKLFNEAKIKAEQTQQNIEMSNNAFQQIEKADQIQTYSTKIVDAEKIREEERLLEEQRLMEAERIREAERLREEEKLREMERLREIERQKEEEKMLEIERLRLKEEEEKRLEMERLEEQRRLKEESEKILSTATVQSSVSNDLINNQLKLQQANVKTQSFEAGSSGAAISSIVGDGLVSSSGIVAGSGLSSGSGVGSGFVLSSQYKNNPYLVRFAAQPGTTTYIVGEQKQTGVVSPNLYYLPAATGVQKQAPLFLRYTTSGLKTPDAAQLVSTAALTETKPIVASAEKASTYSSSSSSSSSSNSASSSFASTGSNLKLSYGSTSTDIAGLSEIEKATREHFRAHELALEQLRLANVNAPYNKDCL